MKRFQFLLSLMLTLTVAVAGWGQSPKVLKVAILAPLSGAVPDAGVESRDGAMLAIDEWNATGGVLGMKIMPIVKDGGCAREVAIAAANEVINSDKVHYIIGEVCSRASLAIAEIATAMKVIQISPSSTELLVTVDDSGVTRPYTFRACFIDPFQAKVGASFAVKNLKVMKAFIMTDPNDGYVRGMAAAFEAAFTQLGGTIVGRANYDSGTIDFSAILSKVKTARPDIVYLPDYYQIVNYATRQARQMGIKTPFMGGDGWDSADLDRKACDGSYFTNHFWPADSRPEVQQFLKVYGTQYKDASGNPIVPHASAALAYDAANVLLQAIKNAGLDDTDKVKAALERITFKAVTGTITFDAQHNAVKGAAILRVTGGNIVFDSFISP